MLLGELRLLGEVTALDVRDAPVVLLVAPLQLGAAAGLGRLQLRHPARLLLRDVALPALLGGRQLLFLAAPHGEDLVAMVALLLLGERLALGRELHRLLLARRRDRLLVLPSNLADLRGQPLAARCLLLGDAPLQPVDLRAVGGLDASQLGLSGALPRGDGLAVLVIQLGHLGAVGLLRLGQPRLAVGAQTLVLAARAGVLLRHALLEPVDLLAGLAQLHVRVVEAHLEGLLPLGRLLAVLGQLRRPLVGRHQVAFEPQRRLFQIPPRTIELPELVLVVQDLPILRVERVAQIEDVFLFLVDDLAQPQELPLLGERRGLREALARLLDLLAQRLPLVLQRVDARLQLRVARLGLLEAPLVHEPFADHQRPARVGGGVAELDLLEGGRHFLLLADRRGHRGGRGRRVLDHLRPQRLAGPVGVRILRFLPFPLVGSLLPTEVRRQVVVGPQVTQIDHVVALRRPLAAPGLQGRERRLRLRIEFLAFERRCAGVAHLVLGGVLDDAVPHQLGPFLVAVGVDDDVLVVLGQHDVGVGVQLVDVILRPSDPDQPGDLRHEDALFQRLEQILVGARLQLLVLLEGRQRLLRRDHHQRDLAQAGAAAQLVGDRVPDLARLHAEDDHRRLVGAAPLHRVVAVRDGLYLESLRLQQSADLIRRVVIRFDCERDSIGGHLVS